MALLAWAAPAARLCYYSLRYRLDWGRDEALDVLAEEALRRRLSSAGVRLLLGEPVVLGEDRRGREVMFYAGDRDELVASGRAARQDFQFDDGALTNVLPWGELWENAWTTIRTTRGTRPLRSSSGMIAAP